MTPAILFLGMLILAAVLVLLLRRLWREMALRTNAQQFPAPKSQPKTEETLQDKSLYADEGSKLLKTERRRKLAASSDFGTEPSPDGFYSEVEGKLLQAFELLETSAISIQTYKDLVRIESSACQRERSLLRARELAGNSTDAQLDEQREQIERAEIAIQWCLDWAEEFNTQLSVDGE